MPNLLFEGRDLSELLAKVRAEHGPNASIVKAERVRVGGIGGFFARQRYEIVVEVDTEQGAVQGNGGSPPSTVTEGLEPTSLGDLAALTDEAERGSPPPFEQVLEGLTTAAQPNGKPMHKTIEDNATELRAAEFLATEEPAGDRPEEPTGDPTESRIEEPTGDRGEDPTEDIAVIAPPTTALDELVDAPVQPAEEIADENVGEAAEAPPAAPPEPAPEARPVRTAAPARAAVPPPRTKPTVRTKPTERAKPTAKRRAPKAEQPGLRPPRRQAARHADRAAQAAMPDTARKAPLAPSAPPAGAPPADTSTDLSPARVARALGIPSFLVETGRTLSGTPHGGGTLRDTLQRALRQVGAPPGPPTRPGAVLAVVGETHAVATASAAARMIGVDAEEVLLASASERPVAGSDRVLPDLDGPASAAWRAPGLHASDHPRVVAVEAALDGGGPEWARSVVEALRPNAVWAVVDATRKVADIADYLRALGQVDAIALYRANASRDPAAIFDLPIPVAMVDGQTATAQVWVDLLCARARSLLGI